jgi:hypothetical protein
MDEEGPFQDLFNNPVERPEVATAIIEAVQLPDKIIEFHPDYDVSALLRKGITINGNKQPAPDNTVHDLNGSTGMYSPLGFNGICEQRKEQLGKIDAKLENFTGCYNPQSLFEDLFTVKWIKYVLINETNKHLDINKNTYSEFLCWCKL